MRHLANWKWALLAAVAITVLSLIPQFLMWGTRGSEWNGSYAELHGDEWVYSAYIQALIDGRPRRNDPYTGRDDSPGQPQPESLFSIQFVPAYVIAVPARLLGISSSTAFLILGTLGPFLVPGSLLDDHECDQSERLAAAASVIVLCFGALAAGQGLVHLFISGSNYSFIPFLRRYEPLAPFPLFFIFCTLVWKSLNDHARSLIWALAAGVALALLVFSYFFLWTTAFAWVVCLALLWLISSRDNLRRSATTFLPIVLLELAALVPYAILLSHRSETMDVGQKLVVSHAPDRLRLWPHPPLPHSPPRRPRRPLHQPRPGPFPPGTPRL